jgi:transcriptional regulator with XRE-family HTH domain
MNIGIKLIKLRMDKKFTQEYIADVLDVCQKTYSNMENNKSTISIDTLEKIAALYKVDLLELITNEKIVVQHNTSQDTAASTFNGIQVNQISEELINQMKKRIEEFQERIEEYKTIIEEYKTIIEEKNQIIANLQKK